MKPIKSYSVMLKHGELEDRFIRHLSVAGGEGLIKTLGNNPPLFIEIKGKMIARSEIAQVMPNY